MGHIQTGLASLILTLSLFSPVIAPEASIRPVEATSTESSEIPQVMIEIARCESGGRQFKEDGTVLRGIVNPRDVGKWQINETYHLARAKELGIDIYTEKGNTEFALLLYREQGTKPWDWSKGCWAK